MANKDFILGYFHECHDDEDYINRIDDFRRAHGGWILLITGGTQIWAFPDDGNEEELEKYWDEWMGSEARTTIFERVDTPQEWAKAWSEKFPVMLEGAVERSRR